MTDEEILERFIVGVYQWGAYAGVGNEDRMRQERDEALIALSNLRDRSECGCLNGILWPQGANSDFSHDWIERCDECAIYEDDDAAAFALAERFGCSVTFSRVESLDRLAPHIDLPRAPELSI